jgi:hypothetical protein
MPHGKNKAPGSMEIEKGIMPPPTSALSGTGTSGALLSVYSYKHTWQISLPQRKLKLSLFQFIGWNFSKFSITRGDKACFIL